MADSPTFFARGHTPTISDTRWFLLQRILGAIIDHGGGGGFLNMSGHGSPVGVVTPTAINVWYRDVDTDNYWWATGVTSANWTPVV